MGLFWDLMQQSAIDTNRRKAESLEDRVRDLEHELALTRRLLAEVIQRLESVTGEDLDGDGKIGDGPGTKKPRASDGPAVYRLD
jgi:hypothetical protein